MIFKTHVVHYDHGFVFIREWRPPTVLGVIHLFHGMMEHSGMYHAWATKITDMGWAVVAHDHAGFTRCIAIADVMHYQTMVKRFYWKWQAWQDVGLTSNIQINLWRMVIAWARLW